MTEKEAPDAITCRDTTWLVSDARERTLTEEEATALARHRESCPFCQGAGTQFDVLFRQLAIYFEREQSGLHPSA